MKKLILILAFLITQTYGFAQTPQGLNYQGIYRDSKGGALSNQTINVKLSILENSANGSSVYSEEHTAQTNAFGLFNLIIGKGNSLSGDFTKIDWGNAVKFLKVEINNTLISTTQLMSVPYALYAENGSQKLSIKDKTISLSKNGGSVTIPKDSTKVRVSKQGDTLWIDNTYVIIRGISAENHGGQVADAGGDIRLCIEEGYLDIYAQLSANEPDSDAVGKWEIVEGNGGKIANTNVANSSFFGKANEKYTLKWTITKKGIVSEDYVKIISEIIHTYYPPFAGIDTVVLNANQVSLSAKIAKNNTGLWSIESGEGGSFSDITKPNAIFNGKSNETYILRWTTQFKEPGNWCFRSNSSSVKIVFYSNKINNKDLYYIPDFKFSRVIKALYPNTMKGDSLIIKKSSEILSLKVTGLNITNFDGLQYMTSLNFLDCSYNSPIYIPEFPNSLDTLICTENKIRSFIIPLSIKYLDCSNNLINFLSNLPNSLIVLKCGGNPLINIGNIPNNLKVFDCSSTQLKNLPLLPNSVTELYYDYNEPIQATLPQNLVSLSLRGHKNIPTLPNSIEILDISETQMLEITALPSNLHTLRMFNVQLQKMPFLPLNLFYLYISDYITSNLLCVTNTPPQFKKLLALYPICP